MKLEPRTFIRYLKVTSFDLFWLVEVTPREDSTISKDICSIWENMETYSNAMNPGGICFCGTLIIFNVLCLVAKFMEGTYGILQVI